MKRDYNQEAEKLAKAITVAIDAAEKYMPENDLMTQKLLLKAYSRFREQILNPKAGYKNLRSLDDAKMIVFTYFQEGKGDTVEYFWKKLKEENIDYKRVNKLDKILKRKKIKNQEEFDFITDAIVPLRQQEEITEEQFESLANMLGDFEARVR